MLAVVLIALGSAMLARALPAPWLRRWLGNAHVVGGALTVVIAGAVTTLITRAPAADPPAVSAERSGICADATLRPICADLVAAARPALDVLARLPLDADATRGEPQLIQPGRGDVYLTQTVVTTDEPRAATELLERALITSGWEPLADPGELRRYRRGSLVAVVRSQPAGSGTRLQVVVTRG